MPPPNGTFQIDAVLRHLALQQLGLITTEQAARAGVGAAAITRRRETGALEPVFGRVLRLTSVAPTVEQRLLAAALAVPGSIIAASSAAAVHGMPVDQEEQPIVAVERTRSARTEGIVIVCSQVELPSRPWRSVRVASPEATLVLLPRFETGSAVERCLDHCLAHRLTTVDRVQALVESLPQRAVVGRRLLLEFLADRASGMGHRSRLERQVALWLDDAGLRGWQRNLRVPLIGGGSIEVDFAWPEQQVALEVSPFFTHGSRAAQERDAERRRLLAATGWRTIEATDPDLEGRHSFDRCAEALRTALARPASGALALAHRSRAHQTSRRSA